MGKIIPIKSKDDSPHLAGHAFCVACKHEWVAVTEVEVFEELECPKCKTMKGVLKYGVTPEVYWKCNCGCNLFVISGISHNIVCWQCGKVQRWD